MNRIFEIKRTFIEVYENLYEVLRVVRETPEIDVTQWKESLGAETVFRREGDLFFVRVVEEAQIITEETVKDEALPNTGTTES